MDIKIGNVSVAELPAGSTLYPRVVFNYHNNTSYNLKAEAGLGQGPAIILKRNNRTYTIPSQQQAEKYVWSFDFILPSLESTFDLTSINGWENTPLPTVEEFYGTQYDNTNKHIEFHFLGYVGNMLEQEIYQPNELDDTAAVEEDWQTYPNGYASYDPETGIITFSSSIYGPGTVYRIRYAIDPITERLVVNS